MAFGLEGDRAAFQQPLAVSDHALGVFVLRVKLGLFVLEDQLAVDAVTNDTAAVDFHHDVPKQIVIVTPSQEGAEPFLVELRGAFVPNRVLAVVEVADVAERAELGPLVKGKLAQDGRPTAYVCERQVCKRPTTDPAVFARQIQARSAVP